VLAYPSIDCIVAAQRQIGETALNEASSRSHQILRLVFYVINFVKRATKFVNFYDLVLLHFLCNVVPQTIESSACEFLGNDKSSSLSASVV